MCIRFRLPCVRKSVPLHLYEYMHTLALTSDGSSPINGHPTTEVCFEKGAVAEILNSFYSTVTSKLVEKLPKSVNKFGRQCVQAFYQRKGVTPNSYSFSMVLENKVLKYLNNFSAKIKLLNQIAYLHALCETVHLL